MKINLISEKYKLSYDTIRYYMKLNLIIPEKRGGYYYFDQDCERDLEKLLQLKAMDFSLQEIKEIFHFERVGKLTGYQLNSYYQSIYKDKVQQLEDRITQLTSAREELEKKVRELAADDKNQHSTIGIDLPALSFFSCPRCQQDLSLSAEKVEANQIIEGSLNCQCGESLKIKEGILYTDNYANRTEQFEEDHIENYIKTTDAEFIDQSYQSREWMQRQLDFAELSGKVVLEPGSGYGHFVRQVYSKLPEDTFYICVDHNPQLNKYLKRLLELTGKRAKIIFITAELPELPLKDNIVDLLIDFTGTSGFSFDNSGFLPELLDHYLKRQITYIAAFIIYHRFGSHNIVPEPCRDNFRYNRIKENLLKQDFKLEKEYKSEIKKIEKSMGKYEDFAQPGDRIHSYQVKAARWS